MSKSNYYYKSNASMTMAVRDALINQCEYLKLETSTVFADGKQIVNPKLRSSKTVWLYADSWVGGMLAHFINVANNSHYKYDLTNWETRIQYTTYETGDHYGWHVDSTEGPEITRKLSVSLCLSDKTEYEGGELQIMMGTQMNTIKMGMGDVIIFPSDCPHRVRKVKSGKRISLVGWYGGPNFK
jgi:PKHD-type hydroxylase